MNCQTQYWSSQKFTRIIPKQLKVNLIEMIEVQSDTLLKHWEVLWNLLSRWFTSIFWFLVYSHVLSIKQQCHVLFADNVSEVLIEFLHQADDIIVYVTIGTAMVKWPKSSQESWIQIDFWQLRGSLNLILYLSLPWIYKADTKMTPKALPKMYSRSNLLYLMWTSILQLVCVKQLWWFAVSRIQLTKDGHDVLLYVFFKFWIKWPFGVDRILSSYADIILWEKVTSYPFVWFSRLKSDYKPCKRMSNKWECQDAELVGKLFKVSLALHVQKPWQDLMPVNMSFLGQLLFNIWSQFWNS